MINCYKPINSYEICINDISYLNMDGSNSEENEPENESSSKQQLRELGERKNELEKDWGENNRLIKEISKAEQLHEKLPVKQRKKNSHLNYIKKEFGEYFNQDSGNTNVEGLDELKDHLTRDVCEIKASLDCIDNDIEKLKNELSVSLSSRKRQASETAESDEKKRSRDNDDDDSDDNSNNSGSSSLPTIKPSSSSSSSDSSGSHKVECDTVNKYSGCTSDNNFYYTKILLDFIISVLNAMSEDDHHNN